MKSDNKPTSVKEAFEVIVTHDQGLRSSIQDLTMLAGGKKFLEANKNRLSPEAVEIAENIASGESRGKHSGRVIRNRDRNSEIKIGGTA